MFEKLLKHLTNAPVAVALAFLLVGAPAAPVAKMLPSSGEVMAVPNCFGADGRADTDCDGVPDNVDVCPHDPNLDCGLSTLDSDGDGIPNVSDPCPFNPDAYCDSPPSNPSCGDPAWGGGSLLTMLTALLPVAKAAKAVRKLIFTLSALLGGAGAVQETLICPNI